MAAAGSSFLANGFMEQPATTTVNRTAARRIPVFVQDWLGDMFNDGSVVKSGLLVGKRCIICRDSAAVTAKRVTIPPHQGGFTSGIQAALSAILFNKVKNLELVCSNLREF
jgi:hypothetical protein